MAPESPSRKEARKERAGIIARCVDESVAFINGRVPGSVRSHPAAGLLASNCYFLVSDAYKLRRGMQNSLTHKYKVAALTAAVIMALRPIRITTGIVTSLQVAFANQQCSMRAAQALLGLDLEKIDADFLRRLYVSVLDRVELPCLQNYLSAFETAFNPPRAITFEEIEQTIPFEAHNVLRLNEDELACLEGLINQFATLEAAYGHPFYRVLFGWRNWWS